MTYDQYWYGDPQMARAFYEAEKLRQERTNSEAWLQGIYFYQALNATVGNMFRKTGTKAAEYPAKPFDLSKDNRPEMDEDEEELFALAYMSSMIQAGQNWKK